MKTGKIQILGGGPAGLAVAYYAHKQGIEFQLFEGSSSTGGNCRTIRDGDFSFDTGAHRLHAVEGFLKDEYKFLLGEDLIPVNAPSRIFHENRYYDFPLTPFDVMKKMKSADLIFSGISYIKRKLFPIHKSDFESVIRNTYGDELASKFLLNYSYKLWGLQPSELHPKVAGKRLKGLDLKTFLVEAFKSKEVKTRHIDGSFYYPKYGIGQLFDKISELLPKDSVRLNAPVRKIIHDNKKILSVITGDGQHIKAEEIISGLPVTLMLRMMDPLPPEEVLQIASRMNYRHLKLVHLKINLSQISKDATIYFPEDKFVFTRVTEPSNRSKTLVPSGLTSLVAEVPYYIEDEINALPESEFCNIVSRQLIKAGLIRHEDVIGSSVYNVPYAYPVLSTEHEVHMNSIAEYLSSFANLQLTGRSGLFSYTHIHDHFNSARSIIERLK